MNRETIHTYIRELSRTSQIATSAILTLYGITPNEKHTTQEWIEITKQLLSHLPPDQLLYLFSGEALQRVKEEMDYDTTITEETYLKMAMDRAWEVIVDYLLQLIDSLENEPK